MKKHLPTILAIIFILSLLSLAIYGIKKITNSQVGYTPTTKTETKQSETIKQENKGYTIKDNQEKGIEVQPENTENFKVIFPTTLQESIKINLANKKSIEITQKNNQDQKKIKESEIKKTTENSKLLDIIKKQPILTIYQDKEQNQTTFYTYKANTKKEEQWQFKHWTIFNNPQKQEIISYKLKNAIINIDENKNAKVYFDNKTDITKRTPDFIIPQPYYLNKDGGKTELTWTYDKTTNTLSTTFLAKPQDYPIAFDPSILQADARIAKFSGKPIDLTSSFGGETPSGCSGTISHGGLTYGIIEGEDGRCWLDRNLGATQVATSATDASGYGTIGEWDDSLQCPAGWHFPTKTEWNNFKSAANITNSATAFASSLKLSLPGWSDRWQSATTYDAGTRGYYWASTLNCALPYDFYLNATQANMGSGDSTSYFSKRCISDTGIVGEVGVESGSCN